MYSLCSIAHVVITTSCNGLNAFVLSDNVVKPCSRGVGTTVSVSHLFHAMPVRLKEFNRTIRSQFLKAIQLLYSYAICNSKVRFLVTNHTSNQTKVVFQSCTSSSLKQLVCSIYDASFASLLEEFNITLANLSVSGLISKKGPLSGWTNPDRQFLFLNNIPFDLPKLNRAINSIFKKHNPAQYPIFLLFLKLDQSNFDRNVTPDKRIIVLEHEGDIISQISSFFCDFYKSDEIAVNIPKASRRPEFDEQVSAVKRSSERPHPTFVMEKPLQQVSYTKQTQVPILSKRFKGLAEISKLENPTLTKKHFEQMSIIGQFNNGFIVARFENLIFIVDQHASHEKYLFEKFSKAKPLVQPLVNKTRVHLDPVLWSIMKEKQNEIEQFELT